MQKWEPLGQSWERESQKEYQNRAKRKFHSKYGEMKGGLVVCEEGVAMDEEQDEDRRRRWPVASGSGNRAGV